MEEDILNYLPTVMFRGTPCISHSEHFWVGTKQCININKHHKTPNVTKRQMLQNAQCYKTPNVIKRPMLQNAQCYKTSNESERPITEPSMFFGKINSNLFWSCLSKDITTYRQNAQRYKTPNYKTPNYRTLNVFGKVNSNLFWSCPLKDITTERHNLCSCIILVTYNKFCTDKCWFIYMHSLPYILYMQLDVMHLKLYIYIYSCF